MNFLNFLPIAAIIDAVQGEFSDAQAETSVGAHASTDILDWGVSDPNSGAGHPIWLMVRVNTAVTAATGSTLVVDLEESQDNSDWTNLWQSKSHDAAAGIDAGTVLLEGGIPATHKRYLRVVYNIGTAVLTAGAFDAFLHLGGAHADGQR